MSESNSYNKWKPQETKSLQVLYWLKQEQPPSLGAIAKAIGEPSQYRGHLVIDVDTWLLNYREGRVEAMLR